MRLNDVMNCCQNQIQTIFEFYLKHQESDAPQLQDAMRYSALNPGKLIRPLLVYVSGLTFNVPIDKLAIPASAIELIHVNSLIHDDLPGMDNADLRRGKPTCHKAFGEALAILAGDTLQSLVYEIIANYPSELTDKEKIRLIRIMTEATGLKGMAAGQTIDILGADNLTRLMKMYHLKTGALLRASIQFGLTLANVKNKTILSALASYSNAIGLAFQLSDDLLNEKNAQETGKTMHLDQTNAKKTYLQLFGAAQTENYLHELKQIAFDSLNQLGEKKYLMQEFTDALFERAN